ncbi:hypothetical protein BS47DRAFT_1364604 [Hydnum rufescens UP504]|uniref:Uncharacterized protein n=1 Tax=Hydnum rufescens UP504 TaxID=1448309 RepID=A0A9P6ART6_9AGAM|nr:hypothetical protein BS47DRAFT_1364604 [Hydnum rufescens UP504]
MSFPYTLSQSLVVNGPKRGYTTPQTYCGVVTRYYRHALQKDNDNDRDYDDNVIAVTVANPASYDPAQTRSAGDSGLRSTKEHTTPQQCWGVVIRDIVIDLMVLSSFANHAIFFNLDHEPNSAVPPHPSIAGVCRDAVIDRTHNDTIHPLAPTHNIGNGGGSVIVCQPHHILQP